jgi:hypothetical protein
MLVSNPVFVSLNVTIMHTNQQFNTAQILLCNENCVCVCVCACVRARAHASVFVCMCTHTCETVKIDP